MKAGLFTAIVTAFVLDAMSDLGEDTSTQLLRLLVEQSTTNSTVKMPPSGPQPSTLTVTSLWFLSIMSSLVATVWAILSLEWCAFLTKGVQADDYEEMTVKMQKRFEDIEHWRMRLVVAAIPSFLHLSLFLFLAGLWLRLRDVNKQLGLIVGVPSLILALSYVAVALLPIFTDAPFFTSASESLQPFVDRIKPIVELCPFIRPPRAVPWIQSLIPARVLAQILAFFMPHLHVPRPSMQDITGFAERVCRVVGLCARGVWKVITFFLPHPTFGSEQNPFNELDRLKVGHSGRDEGIHLRALFWLMSTPLNINEVNKILTEFKKRVGATGKSLDGTLIKILVLSLTSVLEDNNISENEQPIFDHCTATLADEMDRTFEDREQSQRHLFQNRAVFRRLAPHLHLDVPSEETATTHLTANQRENYWSRAIRALWLCPSPNILEGVVNQLDLNIQSIELSRLQRIIRGLRAATIACFSAGQSTLDVIPDFNLWSWDSISFDPDLDKALSSYLQATFAAFFKTLPRSDRPITIPALVVDCLTVLDHPPERYTLKLHSALCFFVVVTWRSDPKIFDKRPLVADALLTSAESYRAYNDEDDSNRTDVFRMNVLAARLRAIAYGPKSSVTRQVHSLTRLGDLYAGLPDPIRTNPKCLGGFLDAYAATLEAVLAEDGHLAMFVWLRSPDCVAARNIFIGSLFALDISFDFVCQHPKYRLPYLYSLAIALQYTTEGRNKALWKVAKLLVTRDEQEGIALDRALDTNILVVTVLKFTLYNQSETPEQGQIEGLLNSLQQINMEGTDWRTRWKSIYLITSLAFLLSKMGAQLRQMQFLIDAASESFEQVKLEPVPSDWEREKKGLRICELESKVKSMRGKMCEGVYEWRSRENVPYLALYNPQPTTPEPISYATHWAPTALRRYVQFLRGGPRPDNTSAGPLSINLRMLKKTLRKDLILDSTIPGSNCQRSGNFLRRIPQSYSSCCLVSFLVNI